MHHGKSGSLNPPPLVQPHLVLVERPQQRNSRGLKVPAAQSRASSSLKGMAPPMISACSWICAFSSKNVQAKNTSSAVAPTTTLPWPRSCATRCCRARGTGPRLRCPTPPAADCPRSVRRCREMGRAETPASRASRDAGARACGACRWQTHMASGRSRWICVWMRRSSGIRPPGLSMMVPSILWVRSVPGGPWFCRCWRRD